MELAAQPTRKDGNCAFHAAFGQWDDNTQEFVYHDIQAIRKRVAYTVKISIAGQLIFPSIVAAIDELIRSTTRVIDLTYFPVIQALRTQFHTTGAVDLDWTNRAMIDEYTGIIVTPGLWLLPCELSIIAHTCQISIRHFIGQRTNPFQIQEYNPGYQVVNLIGHSVN